MDGSLFASYEPESARFFDEVFARAGLPRAHYAMLLDRLNGLTPDDVEARRSFVNHFFLNQGITFTVYNAQEGIERIFPLDLIPRIVPADDWQYLERGLTQRITALNHFLHDLYHKQQILKDGVV